MIQVFDSVVYGSIAIPSYGIFYVGAFANVVHNAVYHMFVGFLRIHLVFRSTSCCPSLHYFLLYHHSLCLRLRTFSYSPVHSITTWSLLCVLLRLIMEQSLRKCCMLLLCVLNSLIPCYLLASSFPDRALSDCCLARSFLSFSFLWLYFTFYGISCFKCTFFFIGFSLVCRLFRSIPVAVSY